MTQYVSIHDNMPDDMSDDMPDNVPDDLPDNVPDDLLDIMPDDMSDIVCSMKYKRSLLFNKALVCLACLILCVP